MSSVEIIIKKGVSGFGVFTAQNIKAGETIANLMENARVTDKPSLYSIQIGPQKHIEARGVVALLNHSCDPNCRITNDLHLVALRDIEAQTTELTYNYLTTELDMAEPFICTCYSKCCWGYIAGYNKLSDEKKAKIQTIYTSEPATPLPQMTAAAAE